MSRHRRYFAAIEEEPLKPCCRNLENKTKQNGTKRNSGDSKESEDFGRKRRLEYFNGSQKWKNLICLFRNTSSVSGGNNIATNGQFCGKKIVGTLALPFPGNGKCLEYVKKVFFASKPRLRLFLNWKIQTRGLEFWSSKSEIFFYHTWSLIFRESALLAQTLPASIGGFARGSGLRGENYLLLYR